MKRAAVDSLEIERMNVISNIKMDTSIIVVERRRVVKTGGNYISVYVNEIQTHEPNIVDIHEILSHLVDHGYGIMFCVQSSHQNKYDSYESTIWTMETIKKI